MVLSDLQIADLEKRVSEGDVEALVELGKHYEQSGDSELAFDYYFKAAKKGNAESQFVLGVIYSEGSSVLRDEEEAFFWWLKSANKGNYQAMYNIGVCYYNGSGTDKDCTEAVRWFEKAAIAGHRIAKYMTAKEYYNGTNVSRDFSKAAEYMSKSAKEGVVNAQLDYALICCTGQGLEKADPILGFAWATCADNNGDKRAKKIIAGIKSTYKLTVRELKQAREIAKELG